jgi:hypothetical protein
MIGDGRFQAQLSTAEKILKKVGLLEERAMSPNKGLGAAHFRGLSYRQVYEECLREYVYDFRLTDQSLLLFVKGGRNEHDGFLNFCYYECPVSVMSYTDFVAAEYGLSPFDDGFDDEVAAWGDDFRADYEQYVTSMELKNVVTPIRYDYSASDYHEGVHPASHVHFGFANEIRVGTRRVMNPISFVLLLVRQRYPRQWATVLTIEERRIWCRNVRDDIDKVDQAYWKEQDELELALD